jgi:uncharacterized membrane protein YdjX (TVP38/TMEM64 family)
MAEAGGAIAVSGGRRRRRLARVALAALGLGALLALGRAGGERVPAFAAWVAQAGWWGPFVFVAGYAGAVVALAPASLLTLAAGAVFGLARGTLYSFAAAVLGSSLAFLVSRHLARRLVERRVARDARFAAIDRAVADEGLRIVFLLRLSPAFPFNLLNYALGLTSVRFRDYLIASLGMLPGTLLYVWSGKLAGDVAALAGGAPGGRSAAEWSLLAVGLAATFAVAAQVARIARRALAQAALADAEPR